MDDSSSMERPRTGSLILGSAAAEAAAAIAKQNERMILQMSGVQRQVTGTTSQRRAGGERGEDLLSALHVGAGESERLITKWKPEQNQRVFTHEEMEDVGPRGSRDFCSQNFLLPAIMSSPVSFPHLWSSLLFFCQTKTPLIMAGHKREEAERKKRGKSMPPFWEDKKLLGFNYFPLVALWICLPLNSEIRTLFNTLTERWISSFPFTALL